MTTHRHSCHTSQITEIWLRLYIVQSVEWLPNTYKVLGSISKTNKRMMLHACHSNTEETDKRIQSQIKVTPPGLFRTCLKKKNETLSQKTKGGNGKKGEEKPPVIKLKQHSLFVLFVSGWLREESRAQVNFKHVYYFLHFSRD